MIDRITNAQITSESPAFAKPMLAEGTGNLVELFAGSRSVGNVLMHGLPDETREWSLEGDMKRKKKKKKEPDAPKVMQCPSCYAMHEPASMCPICGHVRPVKARNLAEVDGELLEITAGEALMLKKKKAQEVGMADTLEALVAIEKSRGYKAGWAVHMFKAKQMKRGVSE